MKAGVKASAIHGQVKQTTCKQRDLRTVSFVCRHPSRAELVLEADKKCNKCGCLRERDKSTNTESVQGYIKQNSLGLRSACDTENSFQSRSQNHSPKLVTMTMAGSSDSPGSQTPMDTTETPAQSNPETSALTTEQIRAMKNITERIYAYREPE